MASTQAKKNASTKGGRKLVHPSQKKVPAAALPPCECDPFAGWTPGIFIKTAWGMMVLAPPPGGTGSYTLRWINGNYVWTNDN